ncbi:MAG TPA: carbohydrate kinase family protein [Acidobacteriaceae bacterium]|jgi:sugar/nucleoside kinase (ribokinase family)
MKDSEAVFSAVLVVGELNVDIVLSGLASPPVLGGEVLAQGMSMVLGSASAIFASGVARLGHPVGFVGKTGDDDFGRFCRDALLHAGISTERLLLSSQPTGATIVLSTPSDRALVTHLGAIADLGHDDLPQDLFAGFRHLHLTSYFLQHRLRPDFARLMREAKSAGLTVSFDPNSDPSQNWSPEIWEVIRAADVVFVNESEARALTGAASTSEALSRLAERTSCAVVKQGSAGATVVRGAETIHVDAFGVNVVDTTGAGDSFAAGFVHGMLTKRSLGDCLLLANAAGALSATGVGGTAAQPDLETLSAFLSSHSVSVADRSR